MVNPKHKRTSLWLSEENLKSLELIDKDRKLIDILNEGTIDLTKIQDFTKGNFRDDETKSHYQYLNWKVTNFLDGKVFNFLEK